MDLPSVTCASVSYSPTICYFAPPPSSLDEMCEAREWLEGIRAVQEFDAVWDWSSLRLVSA